MFGFWSRTYADAQARAALYRAKMAQRQARKAMMARIKSAKGKTVDPLPYDENAGIPCGTV